MFKQISRSPFDILMFDLKEVKEINIFHVTRLTHVNFEVRLINIKDTQGSCQVCVVALSFFMLALHNIVSDLPGWYLKDYVAFLDS